jgi:acetyltransferase-like isoleucine patch superfamily enzyme
MRGLHAAHSGGEMLFNMVGTHIPSHRLRLTWLRALGAEIDQHSTIWRGTTVLAADRLRIGARCNVGWRCVIDARGGITIGDDVAIASDTQLISVDHNLHSPDFEPRFEPIVIESRVWLASRAMVTKGVTVGYGAAVAAGSVAVTNVPALTIVSGVPAQPIGKRDPDLRYQIDFRPRFF